MSIKGNIFNIQRFSVHDGPGIRTTVFMQGCMLSCWWCHNPESRGFSSSRNSESYPVQSMDAKSLTNECVKDLPFFDESGGGVSFSGGEPMAQIGFLKEALHHCKEAGLHTVVDTTAYVSKNHLEGIIPLTDLFLFDLKLINTVQHLKYTGVSNKEILENLQFLLKSNVKLWIRIPIIPGITDTKENLGDIAHLLQKLNFQQQINLLPYHKIAEAKYTRLQIPYRMNGTKEPEPAQMQKISDYFSSLGFKVKIGG